MRDFFVQENSLLHAGDMYARPSHSVFGFPAGKSREISGLVTRPEPRSLLNGLAVHYTMDDIVGSTVVDKVGSYNGTLVGTFTQPKGVLGNAITANGLADYMTVAGLGTWFSGRTQFGMSLWIRPNLNYAGVYSHFCLSPPTHTSPHYPLMIRLLPTSFDVFCTGSSYSGSYYGTFLSSLFHHVVVSYIASKCYAWANGKLVIAGFTCLSALQSSINATAMFGRIPAYNNASNAQRIDIDQVRVYSRALTQDDVDELYIEGR